VTKEQESNWRRYGQRIIQLTKSSLWRHIAKAGPVILVISLSVQALDYMGWLDRFETAGIDTFNILQSPHDPTHVVVVGIDDDDYHNLFHAVSPLDPHELRDLLAPVAKANPPLIGIDIDTSSDTFQRIQVSKEWPPLVWGQDAIEKDSELHAIPILGGAEKQILRELDAKGLSGLPEDPDGVIRRYQRKFAVSGGTENSFPWGVITASCTAGCQQCCGTIFGKQRSAEESLFLNFSGERFTFSPLSADHVLRAARTAGWQEEGILKNRIVLVGGLYREARDFHQTPVGRMSGVQLMAQVIETELRNGGIRPFREYAVFVLDLCGGIFVVCLHYFFRLRLAFRLSLLAMPVLSLISSYVAFSSFSRWFNFVPVLVGVLIHELYDHAVKQET
jgi:CHASE2 domain-containing sensor protein